MNFKSSRVSDDPNAGHWMWGCGRHPHGDHEFSISFLRSHSENCDKLENLLKDSGLVRGEINFKKEKEGEDDSN